MMSYNEDWNNKQDTKLVNGMLGLFDTKPKRLISNRVVIDAREILDVEITVKLYPYTFQKYLFAIELKVGSKRLYVVHKLSEFLDHIDGREPYIFTKQFTYDPELHRFEQANLDIITQLIRIYRTERMYSEISTTHSLRAHHVKDDRMILVLPTAWEALLPHLAEAPTVLLEVYNRTYRGIHISDEALPLQFEFDHEQDQYRDGDEAQLEAQSEPQLEPQLEPPLELQPKGYQLKVIGLEQIVIMESYGIVLYDGTLLRLPSDHCMRLEGLRKMLDSSYDDRIHIPRNQMEPFMEKVVPGLKKLGQVHISQAVSSRIVQPQLKAKLYLDRVKNRLLAGLEFQYGDIILNPFEGNSFNRGSDLILMRDTDKEGLIIELLEQAVFTKTEGGYFIDDEAVEYDFMYHFIPQLEKLVRIYATTAVKERLHTGNLHPIISVKLDERTDWLAFSFDMNGIPESDIRNLLKALEEKRKYYRLPNGALLPLESKEFQDIVRFMNEMGIRNSDVIGTVAQLPLLRGLHLLESKDTGSTIKLSKSLRRLLEDLRNPDNLDFSVPACLTHVLRDYQKYGFQWMKTLAHYRFGGILADDMGLGKTIQSIAFIVSELDEIRKQAHPVFIVCPASLVYNWHNEIKRFAPSIVAVIIDGTKSDRLSALKQVSLADVIITSYPLLRRDMKQFAELTFHTLFLDEAQTFKNHATQTSQAVKKIQARHRFALTGTPMENSVEELWSIFDAVFPELFQDRRSFNDLTRAQVAKRIRPFLLRRLKTDVLKELPEKIESLQASELLPDQKKLYLTYLAKLQQETLKHLDNNEYQQNRIRILAGLTRLRQLCCHPALFVEAYTGGSAKFEQLMEIIEECRGAGKRMLIFSQFTKMLGLIGRELGYQGLPFFYLDGQTPSSDRVELCNKFNDGERDVFLISLKAGGTGLNLTGADTVILYDLWWNPAVEQQAADRAHRIGQKNVVQVIRLVAQGTVEDKMYELQMTKKNLIEEVIQPGEVTITSLTEQDIRDILMI